MKSEFFKKKKNVLYFLCVLRQWQICLVCIHIKIQFNLDLKKMYEEYKNIVLINNFLDHTIPYILLLAFTNLDDK